MNQTTINVTINPTISTYSLMLTDQIISGFTLFTYIIFGLIGNTFNILLFTRPALFRVSSTLYLLSSSITDLFVIILVIPFRISVDAFDQDITNYSLLSCKLVSYIYYVCLALPAFFTVLACADRWAASCVQANRRRFAKTRIAKRLIPLSIILCCLLYSHIFVTFIHDPNPPPPYCSPQNNYAIFALSFYLITYSLIPPFLMALFSISIIFNVIRKRSRIMPAVLALQTSSSGGMTRQNRRQVSQMQMMLICQAISECIFTLPFSIINFISVVVTNDEHFLTIYSYCRLLIFINYVSSFYVYTLSSKLYREELKKLIQRIFNHR